MPTGKPAVTQVSAERDQRRERVGRSQPSSPTTSASRGGRRAAWSSWSFTTAPSVSAASAASRRSAPRNASAFAQSIVSATPGTLREVELAQPLDGTGDVACERLTDVRRARADDLDLAVQIGVVDPVV